MIDAQTVQFRLKFDFVLFIYNSLNFYQFLKKSFSIDINGDVAQKTFVALKCMYRIE